jgi:hypothetical protein
MTNGLWLGCLVASHALLAVAGYVWQSEQPVSKAPVARAAQPEPGDARARDRRFAAALEEFGPGTDFVARMTAGVSSHKRRSSSETTACLTAWLENDGTMALRWLANDPNHHDFNEVLLAHIDRRGDEEIARLLNEAPEASWPVCGLMRDWMKSRQAADLLRIAGQVKGSEARVNLLRSGFQSKPDELIRHLPEIRAMLDERAALEFFWYQSPTREIAAAAEKAGFPDETVKQLNEKAQGAEASQTSLAQQLAMPQKDGTAWVNNTLREIRNLHPELAEWTADFAERGLPAEEVVARLKRAEPELSRRDDDARQLVFAAIFPADAEAATRWLMETRPDWQEALKSTAGSHFNDIRAEEFWRLSVIIDESGAEPILWDRLSNKYGNWLLRDPQGCLIGLDSLAQDSRRDRLIAEVIRIRGSGDKELTAELIRRIDEPGLRAEMEKRSKEMP